MRSPPRIRTDQSNPFAHHTMTVRIPAIIEDVLARNPDFDEGARYALHALRDDIQGDHPLALLTSEPESAPWHHALSLRPGESWLETDWFFAENYVYRQIVDRAGFWRHHRDPFLAHKRDEYRSDAHAEAFAAALALAGSPEQRLRDLLVASAFGNRIDSSFKASRSRGTSAEAGDLLIDDRDAAVDAFLRGVGAVHVIIDNAGAELTLDLVLADHLLQAFDTDVVLHTKVHPAFVSDAIAIDLLHFIGAAGDAPGADSAVTDALWQTWGDGARELRTRLHDAWRSGRLVIESHGFWNGPDALWALPPELERRLRAARLVISKGDAHYRRALNDALWPATSSFADVTSYFPAPLLALRTLKSDPLVGLGKSELAELEHVDPHFRVNGKRALISFGGVTRAPVSR